MGSTKRIDTPAFSVEDGTVTKDPSGSRTILQFNAKGARHIEGGGFEINNVRLLMFDKDGHFVGKRGAEGSRTVIANRVFWMHEVPVDQLALAARAIYEIEYKYDFRRKLIGGELPPLAAESDSNDYFRWLRVDARALEDRGAKYDLTFWARATEVAFTYGFTPKFTADMFRNEFELDLLDAERNVILNKYFSLSLNAGRPTYDDTSVYSIDRKLMRTLKFFELRARTEVRAIAEIEVADL